MKISKY